MMAVPASEKDGVFNGLRALKCMVSFQKFIIRTELVAGLIFQVLQYP